MRLINPGIGEIVDRLSILTLKILHAPDAGHFVTERNALLVMLRGRELNGAWFEHVLTLTVVNAGLWQATDAIRAQQAEIALPSIGSRDDMYVEAGKLGLRIMALNDQRAGLVETINKLTGGHLGSEKC